MRSEFESNSPLNLKRQQAARQTSCLAVGEYTILKWKDLTKWDLVEYQQDGRGGKNSDKFSKLISSLSNALVVCLTLGFGMRDHSGASPLHLLHVA